MTETLANHSLHVPITRHRSPACAPSLACGGPRSSSPSPLACVDGSYTCECIRVECTPLAPPDGAFVRGPRKRCRSSPEVRPIVGLPMRVCQGRRGKSPTRKRRTRCERRKITKRKPKDIVVFQDLCLDRADGEKQSRQRGSSHCCCRSVDRLATLLVARLLALRGVAVACPAQRHATIGGSGTRLNYCVVLLPHCYPDRLQLHHDLNPPGTLTCCSLRGCTLWSAGLFPTRSAGCCSTPTPADSQGRTSETAWR